MKCAKRQGLQYKKRHVWELLVVEASQQGSKGVFGPESRSDVLESHLWWWVWALFTLNMCQYAGSISSVWSQELVCQHPAVPLEEGRKNSPVHILLAPLLRFLFLASSCVTSLNVSSVFCLSSNCFCCLFLFLCIWNERGFWWFSNKEHLSVFKYVYQA